MNTLRLLTLALLISLAASATSALYAQDPGEGDELSSGLSAEELNSELLYEFNTDFDIVFKGVRDALEQAGYEVGYASKRKHLVESAFKILAQEDDFHEVMNVYGKVPYIRSPGWTVGRTKVTVRFEELDEERIVVRVQSMMSGFEARFTNQWHYWPSNGKIEGDVMDAIIAELEGQ